MLFSRSACSILLPLLLVHQQPILAEVAPSVSSYAVHRRLGPRGSSKEPFVAREGDDELVVARLPTRFLQKGDKTGSKAPSTKTKAEPSQAPIMGQPPAEGQPPGEASSDAPSLVPTTSMAPSDTPSDVPSLVPTASMAPSDTSSDVPSLVPSDVPSDVPSLVPTASAPTPTAGGVDGVIGAADNPDDGVTGVVDSESVSSEAASDPNKGAIIGSTLACFVLIAWFDLGV
jgi:hypothetical protein